jgi:hypothetical protein
MILEGELDHVLAISAIVPGNLDGIRQKSNQQPNGEDEAVVFHVVSLFVVIIVIPHKKKPS